MFECITNLWYVLCEINPPAPKWLVDDVSDQTGKVALITGGYSGIGKLVAKYLLKKNATVYIGAVNELKELTGNDKVHFLLVDLSDLESVKQAAVKFRATGERLDQLYNNAGVYLAPMDQLTKQGYDLAFGTNTFAHACLTMLLLPVLVSSAKTAPDGQVRVINVSSSAQWFAPRGGVDWRTIPGTAPERAKRLTPFLAYAQSKRAQIAFSNELAKRYRKDGIVSIALHPGSVPSGLPRRATPWQRWGLETFILQKEADPLGALTPLYAGTSVEAGAMGGEYLGPWARVWRARQDLEDERAWVKVWTYCEAVVKEFV
ncbi:NADP-binding protein [Dacryopinax primogenitus]|uniref:NADP-binding protein n=1 Tax=Dacryopinax primogenitus (strain DJM 731) TaxID=1858805 RepID=M5FZI4_DACPD|nr:NADP-binding protein [Dacryopinax primogenitus]EJU01290.1 NADP-binding protein [Dacryopinax primogenitus]